MSCTYQSIILTICVALSATVVTVSQACGSGGAGVRPLTRADWRGPGAGGARSERPLGFVMVQ